MRVFGGNSHDQYQQQGGGYSSVGYQDQTGYAAAQAETAFGYGHDGSAGDDGVGYLQNSFSSKDVLFDSTLATNQAPSLSSIKEPLSQLDGSEATKDLYLVTKDSQATEKPIQVQYLVTTKDSQARKERTSVRTTTQSHHRLSGAEKHRLAVKKYQKKKREERLEVEANLGLARALNVVLREEEREKRRRLEEQMATFNYDNKIM